jgi:hypothetical protein
MNTAHGRADDLPFDFRHRRRPALFNLPEGTTKNYDVWKQEKVRLIEDLKWRIELTATKAGSRSVSGEASPPELETMASTGSPPAALFLQPKFSLRLLAKIDPSGGRQVGDCETFLVDGPQMFLTVSPQKWKQIPLPRIREAAGHHGLLPMNKDRSGGRHCRARNLNGWLELSCDHDNPGDTWALAQVKNGEVKGIDTEFINPKRLRPRGNTRSPYFPSKKIGQCFERTLENYLTFMRKGSNLELPLGLSVGVKNAEIFRMSVGPNGLRGDCLEPVVKWGMMIEKNGGAPFEYLVEFYNKLWEACALERPSDLRE